MFFIDPEPLRLPVPSSLRDAFLARLDEVRRSERPTAADLGALGMKIETDEDRIVLIYPDARDIISLVLLAAARTDQDLLARAAQNAQDSLTYSIRNNWIDHLLSGGDAVSLETFSLREAKRLETAALEALVPVEGCETARGAWMRVTGPDASHLASGIGQTAVMLWIEKRFRKSPEDGEALPEFYLLVDDPAAPTRAHVTLAAARQADLNDGAEVLLIAPGGHATGYRNDNPYPEFEAEIEALVRAEGLAYRPNWMGRELQPKKVEEARAALSRLEAPEAGAEPAADDTPSP